MRDTDDRPSGSDGKPASGLDSQEGDLIPLDIGESVVLDEDEEENAPPLGLRKELQRRMPPRAEITKIIRRRRGKPDPWLDDKYDWEPKD